MTNKRQDSILAFLQKAGSATRNQVAQHLASTGVIVSNVTLLRDLGTLAHANLWSEAELAEGHAMPWAYNLP